MSFFEQMQSLANNPPPVTTKEVVKVNTYQAIRNEDIKLALQKDGYDSMLQPNDVELSYVNSVFQNKGWHIIDNVTFDVVHNIGVSEFTDLNNKLREFTKRMSSVDNAGIFSIIDELSKDVKDADLEGLWEKAVSAKPTLLSYILSIFDRNAKKKSVMQKLTVVGEVLSAKSGNLDKKLDSIESDLIKQKQQQEQSIRMLENTFELYYNSFMALRKQFALVWYLEKSYEGQLQQYIANNSNSNDLIINKKRNDYESIFADIQNKRLLIWKALLQLPVSVEQNRNITTVCKTLMKEIDNTIVTSFPSIRGNLVTVSTAIMAQKGMLANQSAKDLEENLARLSSKATADLTVKSQQLSSRMRLREAETMKTLVADLKNLDERLIQAKAQSQQDINNATSILTSATEELKLILNK